MLQSKQRLLELNAKLAETLTSKGVTATADETTTSLVNKVADITSGDTIFFSKDGRMHTNNIILPEGLTELGTGAYQNCVNIDSVTIPDGVKNIGNSAFQGCTNLKKCIIGHGVTTVNYLAFHNCNNLEILHLPNTLKTLHNYCYLTSSPKLTEVVLEDGFNYRLDFSVTKLLERETVVNMFNALADRTGLDTLTFIINKVVGNKLTDEDKAIPVSKNWTIAEKVV